jgi:hypothetical protein
MTVPASALEREIGRLSLADRWRLLRWIARSHPAIVQAGLARLPATRKADVAVLSWTISPAAPEEVAGKP